MLAQNSFISLVSLLFLCYNQNMARYKAIISYDGYGFSGFQRQPHARTVQEEIEKTLKRLNSGREVIVHGAGRTDSGVHAYGQVIHFDLFGSRDAEKLRFALDTQTPEDIDVVKVEQVADDFHCRYAKHSKTYEFLVDIGRPKNPMMRHYATFYPYDLDLSLIEQAIKDLEGTHDFTGFTASGTSVENKVRTITTATVEYDPQRQFLIFTFSGNGFLYKQVRNMVGTLLKIGNGRMPVGQIKQILEEKNRDLAGPTAAGNGLYLKEIIYED
ncbi:tRNA pseudouridine synthase A [Streptococcus ruminantium]|nr:tRNA pseudouridine synthase A [Streptococcus ruminantium]BDD41953.1 tRNA pseudouridine synthase A [Streptococcus ruminantium]